MCLGGLLQQPSCMATISYINLSKEGSLKSAYMVPLLAMILGH